MKILLMIATVNLVSFSLMAKDYRYPWYIDVDRLSSTIIKNDVQLAAINQQLNQEGTIYGFNCSLRMMHPTPTSERLTLGCFDAKKNYRFSIYNFVSCSKSITFNENMYSFGLVGQKVRDISLIASCGKKAQLTP